MTLPDERYRAVMWARNFLYDLCDPKKTPGVPKAIREQARSVLRHYPDTWEMQQAAEGAPHVFAEQMEPVYRMFKKYEEGKASLDSTDKS
jgi:hypothetical protein